MDLRAPFLPPPPPLILRGSKGLPSPPCVTVRRVVAPLRGPGQSPVRPFACCVGSLRSVGRCGRCSCWCCFRVRGAPPPPAHSNAHPALALGACHMLQSTDSRETECHAQIDDQQRGGYAVAVRSIPDLCRSVGVSARAEAGMVQTRAIVRRDANGILQITRGRVLRCRGTMPRRTQPQSQTRQRILRPRNPWHGAGLRQPHTFCLPILYLLDTR